MASDTFFDEHDTGGDDSGFRPILRHIGDLARSWNSPIELAQKLKLLMQERPWVALGAAALIGAVLYSRLTTRRHRW